ncbi:MAG: hypothetical protein ACK52U_07955, partial [Synechococcaceae cyanobacterium]
MQALDLPASAGLFSLLDDWRTLLSRWARTGALEQAAQQALRLPVAPQALAELSTRLGTADFSDLPPVQLLPASAMAGAAGAYARSTGTIVLNQEWLASASRDQALAVLTEELGHHLDTLLNTTDTPGDEGELFAALLTEAGPLSDERRQRLLADNDQGSIGLEGRELAVERASLSSTPIPAASPGRTRGEFSNFGAFAALKSDGSVVSWGTPGLGGDSSAVASQLGTGVTQIFSTNSAFAALKADGFVVTWGNSFFGGDSSAVAGQLTNVMAFANPFTDDWLIIDSLPSITLAVSLIPMAEDGAGNLIYTFSRTGSLISELTVTYTVAGTATAGSDYTGIDPAAATRSVVFAPGAATAVVEIDPIADMVGELDEIVALTLLPASGYTIGTTEAV